MNDDNVGFVIPGHVWMVATDPPDFTDPERLARQILRDWIVEDDGERLDYVTLLTDWDLADRYAAECKCHVVHFSDGAVFLRTLWALRDQGVTDVGLDPRKRSGKTFITFVKLETLILRYSGRG
jgi:hypothetical protein